MFDLKSKFSGSYIINLLSWKYNQKLAFYNTQTLLKQLQKNFEKVQKTTFLTPKIVKMTPQNRQNEHFFMNEKLFLRAFIKLSNWKFKQK